MKFLPNGDLVIACSDGIIMIWITEVERMAGTPLQLQINFGFLFYVQQ